MDTRKSKKHVMTNCLQS